LNEAIVTAHLYDDDQFPKILDIVQNGAMADTDPTFVKSPRTAPFRDLQRRLTPVYNKHAATMHAANRVLILPLEDLTDSERADIHMANEYHWRAEPGKIAGRPLMDCSNAQPGITPLNTEATKQLGIARYQPVVLPNLREVVTEWEDYRRDKEIEWSDMWMFKADISNCFNQLHWHPTTAKLMGFMLTATLLMVMLTCGFGVAVTPMVWAVIGDALNRKINRIAPSRTFTYVDDFFGAGTHKDTSRTQQIVHDTINDVLGPEGLSIKKNVHAQKTEILGILIDFTTASMRPKDTAIEKLFYVLFSTDVTKRQPLAYWQCLASLTNLYSHVLHGMRPFVAPIIRMTHRAHDLRPRKATANAQFAIEIWRAVIAVAYIHPPSVAVTIQEYLGAPHNARHFIVVTDASPWRLCAALYDPISKELLLWTTYRLPYARDIRAQYQVQREYLGHLLATILVARQDTQGTTPLSYEWINDNTGALKWAETHKCDSEASQYACLAVTQLHQREKISVRNTTHRAGIHMGEIDTMSRILDNEHPLHAAVQMRCHHTLTPQKYWQCQHIAELQTLFLLVDPSILYKHNSDHHVAYMTVSDAVNNLTHVLHQENPRTRTSRST